MQNINTLLKNFLENKIGKNERSLNTNLLYFLEANIGSSRTALFRTINNQLPTQPTNLNQNYVACRTDNLLPVDEDFVNNFEWNESNKIISLKNKGEKIKARIEISGLAYTTNGDLHLSDHLGFHISNTTTTEVLSGSRKWYPFGISFGSVAKLGFHTVGYGIINTNDEIRLSIACDFADAIVFVDEVMISITEIK